LGAGDERPRSRGTAKKGDELARFIRHLAGSVGNARPYE
jgi:hypothetical protein